MKRTILQTTLVLILASGLPALMAQGTATPKRNINKGQTNFTSNEKETAIGRQAAAQFERGVNLDDDAEINAYIDRIAQNIAKNSASEFPITIKIVKSDEVNARALPGGFIYVNTGVIRAVDNEAELAFVIAHLVGHVAARSATESEAKAALLQIATIPAIILAGGVPGNAIQGVSQPGIPAAMVRFSQEATKEADSHGLEYLYKTGYDPHAAISFMKKLETLEASAPKQSSLLRTVPPAAERIQLMEKVIEKSLPTRTVNTLNTSEFEAFKAGLTGRGNRS